MLASVAVVVAIALAAHLWNWLEPACSNEQRRIVMKAAGGVGCFEFWFNRYQTTIQTIVSGGIGAAGLYFVLKQLAALGQQNAMTRAALEGDMREKAAARRLAMAHAIIGVRRLVRLAGEFLVQLGNFDVNGEFTKSAEDLAKAVIETNEQTTAIFPALETVEIEQNWTEIEARMNSATSYVALRAMGYSPADIAPALTGRPIADDKAAFADLHDAVTRLGILQEDLQRLRRHSAASIANSGMSA